MPTKTLIEQCYVPSQETVDVEDPVWKAWRIIKNRSIKCVPVMRDKKIVGMVSDRDIVQISGYNGGQSMPVKEAMMLNPLIVPNSANLQFVMENMLIKDQQIAVVVGEDSQVLGLFSWTSALKFFLNQSVKAQGAFNSYSKGG